MDGSNKHRTSVQKCKGFWRYQCLLAAASAWVSAPEGRRWRRRLVSTLNVHQTQQKNKEKEKAADLLVVCCLPQKVSGVGVRGGRVRSTPQQPSRCSSKHITDRCSIIIYKCHCCCRFSVWEKQTAGESAGRAANATDSPAVCLFSLHCFEGPSTRIDTFPIQFKKTVRVTTSLSFLFRCCGGISKPTGSGMNRAAQTGWINQWKRSSSWKSYK